MPAQDDDYPYQPQQPAAAELSPAAAWQLRAQFIRRWLIRIALAIGVPAMLLALCGTILVCRAARQAWSISQIERCGCRVTYWHQGSTGQDYLPASIRERLNDRWWGDVQEVTVFDGGYWEGLLSYRETDDSDIRQMIAGCQAFPYLTSLTVRTNFFSCDQIARWPQLNRLDELNVESKKLKNSDLAVIGQMTALRRLRIASGSFTSEGLKHLAPLRKLESLTIEMAACSGPFAPAAPGFPALKSLVVNRSPEFNDDSIASLGSPPNLEEINFNATPIGDRGLGQLVAGRKVRSLIVNAGQITDAGVSKLANCPPPRYLVLSRMPITDAALVSLAGKTFESLILDHTSVTDEAFKALNHIKGIEQISLDNSRVTGVGIAYLKPDSSLQHLDVGGTALTSAGIEALAAAPLKGLSLSGSNLSDRDLMLFVNNDQLTRLTISRTLVTDEGLKAFFSARRKRLGVRQDVLSIMKDPNWDHLDSAQTVLDKEISEQTKQDPESSDP